MGSLPHQPLITAGVQVLEATISFQKEKEQLAILTAALKSKLKDLCGVYFNLSFRKHSRAIGLTIPDELRVRGGSTSGQSVARF